MTNPLILNYHKIEESADIGITSRRPRHFQQDLELLLNNGYSAVTFREWHAGKLPSKAVIITFDDAYESFLLNAMPILRALKMPAVVFVPTAYIGLYNSWDVQFFDKRYKHMTSEQLKEAHAAGHELGSHSHSHMYLNNLSDLQLEEELKKSAHIIEKCCGQKPLALSYPFGKFNPRILNAAGKFYTFAVTNGSILKTAINGNFALPRINVYRFDKAETLQRKIETNSKSWLHWRDHAFGFGAWATIAFQQLLKNRP